MKYLSVILFLITFFAFLIFYNLKYIPLRDALVKLADENKMWQMEIEELKMKTEEKDTSHIRHFIFSWDELFLNEESFILKEEAKSELNTIIPEISAESGYVYIYGYSSNSPPPKKLIKSYPTNWEFAFAKAKVIANYLILMGIPKERIYLVSGADSKPIPSGEAPRRCEIIIQR